MLFICYYVFSDGAKLRRFTHVHNTLCRLFAYHRHGIFIFMDAKLINKLQKKED